MIWNQSRSLCQTGAARALPRDAAKASASFLLLATAGCGYPPTFNILGSYFPSWLVCVAAGAVLTFLTHLLFTRTKIVYELWPLPLLYLALVSLFTCILWLIFFQ